MNEKLNIKQIMAASPVMPVIVIKDASRAVALARALVDGGIRVLEVTLRTAEALVAVRAIRAEVPDALIGVGTITCAADIDAALEAGAHFGVSPGATAALLSAASSRPLPFLPGVMTPSEVMQARDAGFTAMKLFPAMQAGGIGMLKALAGPFPSLKFCPTGGITVDTAPALLALPNVACIGGSWLSPTDVVERGDWAAIRQLASEAAALRPILPS